MADDLLLEEYKILQGKIDKIGDYRFIVKGWSATIILGLLLGTSAASLPAYVILLALPIVFLFYLMESNQKNLQRVLMKRATSLERVFGAQPSNRYKDPNPYAEPIGSVPGIATVVNKFGRRAKGMARAAILSDMTFYATQAVLIVAAFFLHFATTPGKDSARNVYYFNSGSEKPNGQRQEQRSAGEPGADREGQGKAAGAEGKGEPESTRRP